MRRLTLKTVPGVADLAAVPKLHKQLMNSRPGSQHATELARQYREAMTLVSIPTKQQQKPALRPAG